MSLSLPLSLSLSLFLSLPHTRTHTPCLRRRRQCGTWRRAARASAQPSSSSELGHVRICNTRIWSRPYLYRENLVLSVFALHSHDLCLLLSGGVGGVAHGGVPPPLPRRHHRHPVQHWSSSLPNLRPTPVTISDIFSSKSDMSPGQTPNPTASERRGDNLTGFKDFYLNAKAKIWP